MSIVHDERGCVSFCDSCGAVIGIDKDCNIGVPVGVTVDVAGECDECRERRFRHYYGSAACPACGYDCALGRDGTIIGHRAPGAPVASPTGLALCPGSRALPGVLTESQAEARRLREGGQ